MSVPGVAVFVSVKVAVLIVDGSIASLKVAFTELLITTPVVLLAGSVRVTVGWTLSTAVAVNVQGFGTDSPLTSGTAR